MAGSACGSRTCAPARLRNLRCYGLRCCELRATGYGLRAGQRAAKAQTPPRRQSLRNFPFVIRHSSFVVPKDGAGQRAAKAQTPAPQAEPAKFPVRHSSLVDRRSERRAGQRVAKAQTPPRRQRPRNLPFVIRQSSIVVPKDGAAVPDSARQKPNPRPAGRARETSRSSFVTRRSERWCCGAGQRAAKAQTAPRRQSLRNFPFVIRHSSLVVPKDGLRAGQRVAKAQTAPRRQSPRNLPFVIRHSSIVLPKDGPDSAQQKPKPRPAGRACETFRSSFVIRRSERWCRTARGKSPNRAPQAEPAKFPVRHSSFVARHSESFPLRFSAYRG